MSDMPCPRCGNYSNSVSAPCRCDEARVDFEKFLRDAPCMQPGFVFKPYVYYSHEGNLLFAHWENVPDIHEQITPEIAVRRDHKTGRIIGVAIALPIDALRSAHAAGRREGIEEAAKVCDHEERFWRATDWVRSDSANRCAEQIRALVPASEPKEAT